MKRSRVRFPVRARRCNDSGQQVADTHASQRRLSSLLHVVLKRGTGALEAARRQAPLHDGARRRLVLDANKTIQQRRYIYPALDDAMTSLTAAVSTNIRHP